MSGIIRGTVVLADINNYDTGSTAVPVNVAPQVLTATSTNVNRLILVNTTNAFITFTLTDTAGNKYFNLFSVGPFSTLVYDLGGLTLVGIKWCVSAAGLVAQLRGKQ